MTPSSLLLVLQLSNHSLGGGAVTRLYYLTAAEKKVRSPSRLDGNDLEVVLEWRTHTPQDLKAAEGETCWGKRTQVRGFLRAPRQHSTLHCPRTVRGLNSAEVGVDVVGTAVVEGRLLRSSEDGGEAAQAAEREVHHEGKLEANQHGQGARPLQNPADHLHLCGGQTSKRDESVCFPPQMSWFVLKGLSTQK